MTETLRRLVLHARHEALGARLAPFAGHEMPIRYGSLVDEHHAVRQRVGVFDVSHMGEVFVRGRGAIAAVNRLMTNDASALDDGRAMYTAMCLPDGGIVDDLIVYRLREDEVLICVNAGNRHKDFAWIRDNLQGDAVAVDESDAWSQLAIQGPRAVELVAGLTSTPVAEIGAYRAAWGEVAGRRSLISRTGYTGEDGFELYVANEDVGVVFDAVMEAGAAFGALPVGLGARDTLRLEAKMLLYGNDIDETTNPLEAGLGWVTKFEKGDFIGRDALLAVRAAGPRRRLRGFTMDKREGVLRPGYALQVEGDEVGRVTSGSPSPTLGDVSVGLGYIDTAHADRGSIDVLVRGRSIPARVTTKAFYKRPGR